MMKKIFLLFVFTSVIVSCGTAKVVRKPNTGKANAKVGIVDKIVWTAVSYKGVPYKFGGTTNSGMDCSGLIYTSFRKRNVALPRTSKEMYGKGYVIPVRKVQRGDLLFFKTAKTRAKVNHVGLVTSVKNKTIKFIHATSSRGVLVSSLNERYWRGKFVKAKRVL